MLRQRKRGIVGWDEGRQAILLRAGRKCEQVERRHFGRVHVFGFQRRTRSDER